MFKPIRIGCRPSPLALAQVDEVFQLLTPQIPKEIIIYQTAGDKDKTSLLSSKTNDNFFTNTIDEGLINEDIDLAIHSAKDLPHLLDDNLKIIALTKSLDASDALVGNFCLRDLPIGARIGTSGAVRRKKMLQLRSDILLVEIRGTIQERINLVGQGLVDGVIIATCALQRLKLDHLIKDVLPWDGIALQGQLAIVAKRNNYNVACLFEKLDIRQTYGKVSLVGAGPGDPELITLKAIKTLNQADVVYYDYLMDVRLLDHAPQAKHIYAGKRKGEHSIPQDELNRSIKDEALSGKKVVRLKGGDPLVFGRGAEEMLYLREYHIPVSIIPGVSSATGLPSMLGVPLTARDISSSVAFLSAHEQKEDAHAPSSLNIPNTDTLVFLMGLTKLPQIVDDLKKAGKSNDFPMMIISKGTYDEERIIMGTLSNIIEYVSQEEIEPPALIIAGNVVKFYKERPKKKILYLGTNPQYYHSFGQIIHWPMLNIAPINFLEDELNNIIEIFEKSNIVIFTSRFAVEYFMDIIKQFTTCKSWSDKIIACVGTHTADAISNLGLKANIVASIETAQGLFKAISEKCSLKNKKVLFPRSNLPNPFLKDALMQDGALVYELTVYTNSKINKRPLPNDSIDTVIFTSPSTVKYFFEDYGTIPNSWEIIVKGPETKKMLHQYCENLYDPKT